jgi:hypothetical protein
MEDFPAFMKSPVNRIAISSQATPGVEGYVFDGADGSQMAFWTCREAAMSDAHVHDYDEYMLVVQGCYTLIFHDRDPGTAKLPVGSAGCASALHDCYNAEAPQHGKANLEIHPAKDARWDGVGAPRRVPVHAGQEYFIPKGQWHSGEPAAGTRTIHCFGGHRADRALR